MTSGMENEVQTVNETKINNFSKSIEKGIIENGMPNDDDSAATGRQVSTSIFWTVSAITFFTGVISVASIVWLFLYVKSDNALLRDQVGRAHIKILSIENSLQDCELATNRFGEEIKLLKNTFEKMNLTNQRQDQDIDERANELVNQAITDVKNKLDEHDNKLKNYDYEFVEINDGIYRASDKIQNIDTELHYMNTREQKMEEEIEEITTNVKTDEIEQMISTVNATLQEKMESLRTLVKELTKMKVLETNTLSATGAATTPTSTSNMESTTYETPDSPEISEEEEEAEEEAEEEEEEEEDYDD